MPTEIEMCHWYNALRTNRCDKGRWGGLKCHSARPNCPDYEPSYFCSLTKDVGDNPPSYNGHNQGNQHQFK